VPVPETSSPQKDKKPALDPVEASHHNKTHSRAAQDSIDMAIVQQHLKMIQAMVEKMLPAEIKPSRSGVEFASKRVG
jgi:hypothetical protein